MPVFLRFYVSLTGRFLCYFCALLLLTGAGCPRSITGNEDGAQTEQIEQANMYLQGASGNLSSACGAAGSSGPSSSGPMVPALPSDDVPMPDDVMGALGDLLAEGQALATMQELGALMDALPSPSPS